MKKILFLAIMISLPIVLVAQSAGETLKSFIQMEKGHKADWFDFMKNHIAQKTDLLKKHHNEWADFKQTLVTLWGSGTALSNQPVEQAIALHKKQNNDWKALNDSIQAQKTAIIEKHAKDLAQFESTDASKQTSAPVGLTSVGQAKANTSIATEKSSDKLPTETTPTQLEKQAASSQNSEPEQKVTPDQTFE